MGTKEELAIEYSKKYDWQVSSEGLQNIQTDFIAGYEAAQRWVSIRDGWPPYGVQCLLLFVNKTIELGYFLEHKHRGFDFYSHSEPDIEFIFQAVTHWMSLPQLPNP